MPFLVPIEDAQRLIPEYKFIRPLNPSEQKAAFQVCDEHGNNFCVKIISPNYEFDRIRREILAMQEVDHDNVAKFIRYELSTSAAGLRHFIVEEYVDGQNLSEVIKTPLSRENVANLFIEICNGLHAIHTAGSGGIVHRDLKPSNIRVRPNGSPVIIDLGAARHLELPALTRTADGARIGTPLYFAPEQFLGNKYDIDPRTDLFALGVILYEILIKQHPFYQEGMSEDEFTNAVCNLDGFTQNSGFMALHQNWRLLIIRLLDKDRVRRPRSAEQVASVLNKIRGE